MKNKIEDFVISSVCREDLQILGYDTSKLSDDDMEEIADFMSRDYHEQMYRTSLECAADYIGVPKKK